MNADPTPMTPAKQLALTLVREIVADKRARHVAPAYALRDEVTAMLGRALDALAAEGSLVQHEVSVNRHIAYEIPCQREQK